METLKRKVEEQERKIAELEGRLEKPVGVVGTLLQVKDGIEREKVKTSAQEIDAIYANYVQGTPEVATEEHVATLVDYSVNFVESNAPRMMQLLGIAIVDKSPFKLNTCIALILMVLPPAVKVAMEFLRMMINGFVYIKNKAEKAIDDMLESHRTAVVPVPAARKKRSLQRWLKGE